MKLLIQFFLIHVYIYKCVCVWMGDNVNFKAQ